MGSPSPAPPTYQDIRNAVNTDLSLIGTELGVEAQNTATASVDAYILAVGGGVTPKDAAKALQNLYTLMGPARDMAKASQLEKIVETKTNNAANSLDVTNPEMYESEAFSTLTADEKKIARSKYASQQIREYMSNAGVPGTPAPTVNEFLVEIDNQVAAGAISPEMAAEIRNKLNSEVANRVSEIQSDLDGGAISATDIQNRINAIPNPNVRNLVESKFKGELQGVALDSRITSDLGNAATTRASVEAHIASLTPDQAKEYRDKMQGKLQARAQGYRDALAAGGMTVADVSAAIGALPSQFEKDELNRLLSPDFSGREVRDTIESRSNISGIDNARRAVEQIINSDDFKKLSRGEQRALKEAVREQVKRLDGTDNLYSLREEAYENKNRLTQMEVSRKTWEQNLIRLKRLVVPALIAVAIGSGGGLLVGIGAGAGMGMAAGIGAGIVLSAAAGGIMSGGYEAFRGLTGYIPQSDIEIQKLLGEIDQLLDDGQVAYNDIHTVRAERASMPIQAITEAGNIAAEVSWAVNGQASGLPKDEFIKRFNGQHNLERVNAIRRIISGLDLTPASTPLTADAS